MAFYRQESLTDAPCLPGDVRTISRFKQESWINPSDSPPASCSCNCSSVERGTMLVLRRPADANSTNDPAAAGGGLLKTGRIRADRARTEARQRADRARQRANRVRKGLQESEQVQEEVRPRSLFCSPVPPFPPFSHIFST